MKKEGRRSGQRAPAQRALWRTGPARLIRPNSSSGVTSRQIGRGSGLRFERQRVWRREGVRGGPLHIVAWGSVGIHSQRRVGRRGCLLLSHALSGTSRLLTPASGGAGGGAGSSCHAGLNRSSLPLSRRLHRTHAPNLAETLLSSSIPPNWEVWLLELEVSESSSSATASSFLLHTSSSIPGRPRRRRHHRRSRAAPTHTHTHTHTTPSSLLSSLSLISLPPPPHHTTPHHRQPPPTTAYHRLPHVLKA